MHYTQKSITGQPLYSSRLQAALERLDKIYDWHQELQSKARQNGQPLPRRTLQPSRTLLSRLANPHHNFSAIHITGSKGKGSVATLITAALLHASWLPANIGTFCSPHVERVNERICVNASPISDHDLAEALTETMDAREAHPPVLNATRFPCMTAAAFCAFRQAAVRWAVVEVGIGGRLDPTNVISAPVAVITNVHLEHAHFIGPSLEDIAHEKAGIIRPGADVICGLHEHDDLAHVFIKEAVGKSPPARIQFCPPRDGSSLFEHNLSMARAAVQAVARNEGIGHLKEDLLPLNIAERAIASLPARQEVFVVPAGDSGEKGFVRVLLDGAHVAASVAQVLKDSEKLIHTVVLLGVSKNKEVHGICTVIHEFQPEHIFASATSSETCHLQPSALTEVLKATGKSPVTCVSNSREALRQATALACQRGRDLVVIGSLYFAGQLRPELHRLQQLSSHSNSPYAKRSGAV